VFPSGHNQTLEPYQINIKEYLSSFLRVGGEFWIDAGAGHNALASLYLRFCSNKSVAVEHMWHNYLRTYGAAHLRRSTRGLRNFTANIRKIDETSGIRGILPYQLGFVTGYFFSK
jgi:hypothetical protein